MISDPLIAVASVSLFVMTVAKPSTMTPESIIALATPVAVIVAAVIQMIHAKKAERDRAEIKEKAEQAAGKIAEVGGKVDQVHVLANDNLSQMTTALKIANERIAGMERMLTVEAEAKKTAHELAMKGQIQVPPPPPPSPPPTYTKFA